MYNLSGRSECYKSIMHLPHPVSKTRPQMSRLNRAAQFAPFDALAGYGAATKETARLTDVFRELDEGQKAALNRKLFLLFNHKGAQPEVRITFFCPDERKDGGEYVVLSGRIKKLDPYSHTVVMQDRTQIPIDLISEIDSDLLLAPM